MFYNNGTIYQTTFEQDINIPKLGENLAKILNHVKKLYNICNYNIEDYKKLIFETDDMSIIILKLGEDSNIAFFFKREEEKELKLTAIKRYLTRIEELIDMDERELIIQEIITKEEELKRLKELLNEKKNSIEKLTMELKDIEDGTAEGFKKEISKELEDLEVEYKKLNNDIENHQIELEGLKKKIEKSHKESH